MDTSRVGVGEAIAGLSAFALFIFMFLPWYGVDAVGGFGVGDFGEDLSAWEAFSFIDILLFLVCVAVIGLVLARVAGADAELPAPAGQIIIAAGGVALVLIVFRLIFAPGVDGGGFEVDVDLGRKFGILLGMIAAAGIAAGGWTLTNEAPGAAAAPDGPSTRPPWEAS